MDINDRLKLTRDLANQILDRVRKLQAGLMPWPEKKSAKVSSSHKKSKKKTASKKTAVKKNKTAKKSPTKKVNKRRSLRK